MLKVLYVRFFILTCSLIPEILKFWDGSCAKLLRMLISFKLTKSGEVFRNFFVKFNQSASVCKEKTCSWVTSCEYQESVICLFCSTFYPRDRQIFCLQIRPVSNLKLGSISFQNWILETGLETRCFILRLKNNYYLSVENFADELVRTKCIACAWMRVTRIKTNILSKLEIFPETPLCC